MFLALLRTRKVTKQSFGGHEWQFGQTYSKRLRQATVYIQPSCQLTVIRQNPVTTSKWALLAQEGHEVFQVLLAGQYIGVIVDGAYQAY